MNFKNLKTAKNLLKSKFQVFGVFKVDWTSLLPTELKFYIFFIQNHFSSKTDIFAFLTKKNSGLKDNCSEIHLTFAH